MPRDPERSPQPSHDLWLVGRLGRPVGLRGECVFHPESHSAEDLERAAQAPVRIVPAGESPEGRPTTRWEGLRTQGHRIVALFDGLDSREAIQARTHWEVWVDRVDMPPLDEPDTWWVDDLVGCEVLQVGEEGDVSLGLVTAVAEGPAHDYLSIETADGRALHVPLVRAYLREVDLERKRILLDLPEGLTSA
ncbi:16S rRNA processing protein RimM [Candidatus Sumerlaeota bacterium]|nr:16S rRNA processing protein RimM [Candidatus Sumerlaeota bacterium]